MIKRNDKKEERKDAIKDKKEFQPERGK